VIARGLSDIAFVTRRRRASRYAAASLEKPESYSLGYRWGFFKAENKVDARPSFSAVERSMSDRLLGSGF